MSGARRAVTKSSIWLTVILLGALVSACGARVAPPASPGAVDAPDRQALAPIIVDDTRHPRDGASHSFSRTVEADAELFGRGGAVAGKVTGCVAGVVAFGFLAANGYGGGHDGSGPIAAFCYLGAGAGYLVGYGIGAMVGTVHGSVKFVANDLADGIAGAFEYGDAEAPPHERVKGIR